MKCDGTMWDVNLKTDPFQSTFILGIQKKDLRLSQLELITKLNESPYIVARRKVLPIILTVAIYVSQVVGSLLKLRVMYSMSR